MANPCAGVLQKSWKLFFISILNIVFWVCCLSLEVSTLACYGGCYELQYQGIWCGIFYLTAGIGGCFASFNFRKQILKPVAILACLAVVFAITGTSISSPTKVANSTINPDENCIGARVLEYCLYSFHVTACISDIFMVLLITYHLVYGLKLANNAQPSPPAQLHQEVYPQQSDQRPSIDRELSPFPEPSGLPPSYQEAMAMPPPYTPSKTTNS